MRISYGFLSLPSPHVGMHHFSNNGAGPDDGDLHHEIVELDRSIARKRSHLRPAFDLKHSNCVRASQRFIDGRIVGRKLRQIDRFAVVFGNQFQTVFEHGHHPEAQQIHLHDAHVGAIVLVPLHDDTPRHRCRFERNNRIKLPLTHNHSTGMLAQVPRQILNAFAQLPVFSDARVIQVETYLLKVIFEVIGWPMPFAAVHYA